MILSSDLSSLLVALLVDKAQQPGSQVHSPLEQQQKHKYPVPQPVDRGIKWLEVDNCSPAFKKSQN